MINRIRNWLYEPKVRGVNVDDNGLLAIHREVLLSKPLLRSAFEAFYRDMVRMSDQYLDVPGSEVELGTGAGFFKKVRPAIITSDVREGPGIDLTLDAQSLALPSDSVRCIYAINVFHHLPNPELFLSELTRVLRKGGGCVLIEPHSGFASSFLHTHLHQDEHFDPNASGWQTMNIGGPLSGANQALAYIVFQRDLSRFIALYGDQLELVHQCYVLNALRYLFSGGLNFRQMLPSCFEPALRRIEQLMRRCSQHCSLHQITVIRKK